MPAIPIIVAVTAVAGLGLAAASAAGAFTPKFGPSKKQIDDQTEADKKLLAQTQDAIARTQSSAGVAKVVTYAAVGLAAAATIGVAVVLVRSKKKK
jgi:adenine/guanine phosphoribosyltransferase-like PRPP-binding protein